MKNNNTETPFQNSTPAAEETFASSRLSRRKFLSTLGVATAGLTILPSGTLFGGGANGRLNLAIIGAHGRASQLYQGIRNQNVVALCDVNADNMALAAKEFPRAKQYVDWRKCLEQKDIDAVVCCTPDHTHAFIGIWAMNRGYHIYLEKPLANSVMEARMVRETYLKNRHRLATQHGTQRHAIPNCARIAELIKHGAIGELRDVHTWGDRTHEIHAYHPAGNKVPSTLDWDLWCGPSPVHPYHPAYFAGNPGLNCLEWNMFRDFGSWQMGDMGSHTIDFAWNALDASPPTSIRAEGDDFNPAVAPSKLRVIFTLPPNDWRGEIRLVWHQGGFMPNNPTNFVDLRRIGHGMMFVGSKGTLVADFRNRILIPTGNAADMTYFRTPAEEDVRPNFNFFHEWVSACRGDLTTSCNFDYSGHLIETLMLGLVAHEAGTELNYDSAAGRVTNHSAAHSMKYFQREYRDGWVLNG